MGVLGYMKGSKPAFKNMNLRLGKKLFFRKQLMKIFRWISSIIKSTHVTNVKKPNYKKEALTTHIKKAHNISKTTTYKKSNKKSDNNDKTIEIDKLEEQE